MATNNDLTRGYQSPGVGYTEKEILPLIIGPNQLVVGIVGGASKGPEGNVVINTIPQLRATYGMPTTHDFGLLAAEMILRYSNQIIYNRVISSTGARGVAGSESDLINLRTETPTDDLNGAVATFTLDAEAQEYNYTLVKDGVTLEVLTRLSTEESSPHYILSSFDTKSRFLNMIRTGAVLTEWPAEIVLTIADGNSGIEDLTSADIVGAEGTNEGLKAFGNAETIDVSTIITPGWSDDTIKSEMDKLTRQRGDVMCIIDPPRGLTPQGVIDWSNATGDNALGTKLDNQWITTYYPWVQIYDHNIRSYTYVPPSVVVAAQWAYSDRTANCWFVPAGIDNESGGGGRGRGYIEAATGVEYQLTREQRDMLYGTHEGVTNVINPINFFLTQGIVLWGNKTTLRHRADEAESLFSSLHIRRLCNYIRKFTINISRTELFNPNDKYTWDSWKLKIERRLREIRDKRGIVKYRVIMDESTVTADDIRLRRMPGQIWVMPTGAAEFIPITFTVTSENVYFEENLNENEFNNQLISY